MEQQDSENNPRFSPEVEFVLREAGWFPGREVEESQLEQWYVLPVIESAACCRIFPVAYRFLREFGGLELSRYQARNLVRRDSLLIDPLKGVQEEEYRYWLHFEWLLETTLYPLGAFDHSTILIDGQGRIWDLMEEMVLLGNSPEEGLSNLILDRWLETRVWAGDHRDEMPLIDRIEAAVEKFCTRQ